MSNVSEKVSLFHSIIDQELKPYVKKIDAEAFYARDYLLKLGKAGFFSSEGMAENEYIAQGMQLVEETAKVCLTTAFCLWCHFAGLTYVRKTENEALKKRFLPSLEKGEFLAATGLSNPMKYYAGLEDLRLSATEIEGGYLLSGVLPAVSNLAEGHWFGAIANVDDGKRVMFFVPCNTEGLKLKERVEFFGVNGSATYSCQFNQVFIPHEYVLSDNADEFCEKIRPAFILYQIPIGLGVIKASIASIEKMKARQNGCNQYLRKQAVDIEAAVRRLEAKKEELVKSEPFHWKEIAAVRLETAYLTLEAAQESMLHHGSAGYLKDCAPSRRLREAFFFANLTPTIKHLEKVLCVR